jgi:hypothetical protein
MQRISRFRSERPAGCSRATLLDVVGNQPPPRGMAASLSLATALSWRVTTAASCLPEISWGAEEAEDGASDDQQASHVASAPLLQLAVAVA